MVLNLLLQQDLSKYLMFWVIKFWNLVVGCPFEMILYQINSFNNHLIEILSGFSQFCLPLKEIREPAPGRGGGSNMEHMRMLVGNFEFNP